MSTGPTIRHLLTEGHTAQHVATTLSVSIQWVRMYARAHGLPLNSPPPPWKWKQILRALQSFNYDWHHVGKVYGFSPKALYSLYTRAYPPSSDPPGSIEQGAQESTPCPTVTPPTSQENAP